MHLCSAEAYNKIDGDYVVNSVAQMIFSTDFYHNKVEIPKNCIFLFGNLRVLQIFSANKNFLLS